MRNSREKGKIPVAERPRILARYAAGERLAQIARDYGCTPAAIRYIVNRSRLRPDHVVDSGAVRGDEAVQPLARPFTTAVRRREVPLASGRDASAGSSDRRRFLDPELHTRVTGDAVTFLAALDQTASDGSVESLEGLREAIDRLMRSAARTSLEVGRLLDSRGRAGAAAGHVLAVGN